MTMIDLMSRRRQKGTGERPRRQADGRWRTRYTGTDRRRHAVYGRTAQEAADKRDEALRGIAAGIIVAGSAQTLEHFLRHWLDDVARHNLRGRSWERYDGLIRKHVLPDLGRLRLTQLTPQHVQKLYADLPARRQSAASIRYLHAVLHGALDQAVRWQLLARNPVDAVTQPRRARTEMAVLDPDQVRTFLEAAAGHEFHALWLLAITTGMRSGELLGLRWEDIDWTACRLAVRRTLSRVPGRWWVDEPKTSRSRRAIQLTEPTLAVLRAHRIRQAEQLLRIGHRVTDGDFVFLDAAGDPLQGNHLTERELRPLLVAAGLPRIRFHDLRHTAATLLLASGTNPKVVSEMLGHSTVTLTLDTYAHVLPTMQAEAVQRLDQLLGRGAG